VHTAIRWLDVLFGRGDDDYPFWLLTIRVNILLFVLCVALLLVWNLSSTRLRQVLAAKADICTALGLTAVAAALRFFVASPNLMDYGGIAYSRLLFGYKGYFATAQFFSLFYRLTARDIEHAILFDQIAGTLTIPLVYLLCRRLQSLPESSLDNRQQTDRQQTTDAAVSRQLLQPGTKLLPATAAFLFAVYPLHILFSASDALAIFSLFLAATAYAILAGAEGFEEHYIVGGVHYLGAFAGLALLTQVRYENLFLLVPPAVFLLARRDSLRLQRLVPPLVVSAIFMAIYLYAATTAGLSYQDPIHLWSSLDMMVWRLALNPFLGIPVLLIGTAAIWGYTGAARGILALLPWIGVFVLAALTTDSGHSAARIYANWLILILPPSGYGFSRMLSAPQRAAKAVAAGALLYLGLQPSIMHAGLAAQYVEMVENDRFRSLLATLPPGVQSIIVPDDAVTSRQPHSTFEVYRKYATILAGCPEAARRVRLVALTDYLEHPQQTSCMPGACVFFFGLPCIEPGVYSVTSGQCQELLRTQTTVVAAPFVDCSIYTGTLRERLCDPVTTPHRFAVYQIQE
jgi:hypothetical protein